MKKKLMALVVAMALTLALCAPSFATEADGGISVASVSGGETASITVENVEAAATVNVYQIMTVNFDTTTQSFLGYEWVSNVGAWVQQNASGYSNPSTALPSGDDVKGFYEQMAAAIAAGSLSLSPIASQQGSSTFNGLAMGQYLLLVSGGVNVYEPMIGNTAPRWENNAWTIPSPTITAKATTPSLNKTINADVPNGPDAPDYKYDTVAIGDTVIFDIYADVPTYPSNAVDATYTIGDTMSAGLTYQGDFVVSGLVGDAATVLPAAAYTLNPAPSATSQSFTVEFVYAQIAAYDRVHIQYKATVNAQAELASENNKNTATLTYSTNPYVGGQYEDIPSEVKVYTYGLRVLKVDGNDTTPLPNAQFQLRTAADDESTAISFVLANGIYKRDNGTGTGATTTLTTDTQGRIQVDGLDEGTYYLRETKAPDGGYSLLSAATTVTITKDGTNPAYVAGGNTEYPAHVFVEVPNYKTPFLPSTGGMGTTIFTIVGAVLMMGAVIVLLVISRKKAKANKGE